MYNLKLDMKQYYTFCLFLLFCFTIQLNAQELKIENRVNVLTSLAREPMIVEHPYGALFLAGYKNATDIPQLWKSNDFGETWETVDVGTYEEGAQGNSDVDLFIDGEGNIFFLSMTFTKVPEEDMENFDFSIMQGKQITIGVSRDIGQTWEWQNISKDDYDDRPWIRATTDGNLHIIWNNKKGLHHSISKDKGETWQRQEDIHPKGGSSFMASGPNGQLAVRVAPLSASAFKFDEGIDLIRLSLDNGQSWQDIIPPGKRNWSQNLSNGIPRWVEPIAWDSQNQLYTLWSEGKVLKLGVSANNGENWQEFIVEENLDTLYFPYMTTHKDKILCTWVSGFEENTRHNAAVIQLDGDNLEVMKLSPQKLDIWTRFDIGENELSTGGEYFPIIPLSNGNFGMATTIQNRKDERFGFTWWELSPN